jgi:hypothetical protein
MRAAAIACLAAAWLGAAPALASEQPSAPVTRQFSPGLGDSEAPYVHIGGGEVYRLPQANGGSSGALPPSVPWGASLGSTVGARALDPLSLPVTVPLGARGASARAGATALCADSRGSGGGECADVPKKALGRGLHYSPWFVTLEVAVVQTASIFIFAALPHDVSGFSNPTAGNIVKYASRGPHFDDDRWGFNYIGHPLAGSEYYLILRNRKGTWWQSLIYAAGWSAFWEYVTEGLYEQASIQDLIVTPIAGAALGELRYQLRRALLDPSSGEPRSLPIQLLAIALDPIQAITEFVPLKF